MKRWLLAVGLAVALFSCPSKKPDSPLTSKVTLTLDGWDDPIEVKVGESKQVAIHVTNPDGTPATGYTLYTPDGEGFTLEHLSDGEERLIITPVRPATLRQKITAIRGPEPTTSHEQDLTFFGGPTDELFAFPSEMSLVPGESRSLAVLPFTHLGQYMGRSVASPSSDVPTFESSDATVVAVTASGAFTTVKEGRTTVTVRAGNKTLQVPVSVVAGQLRTPSDERVAFDPAALTASIPPKVWCGGLNNDASSLDKLVLDARGWPLVLSWCTAQTSSGVAGLWALLRWTGSGFGAEAFIYPDAASQRDARLTLTADGQIAVLLESGLKTTLFTRPIDTVAQGWHRQLIFSLNDWSHTGEQALLLTETPALLARNDAGVFVARWQPLDQGADGGDCTHQLQLAAVHDALVERTHWEFAPGWRDPATLTCTEAKYTRTSIHDPVTLLRQPAGEKWPRVFTSWDQDWVLDPHDETFTVAVTGLTHAPSPGAQTNAIRTALRGVSSDTLLLSGSSVPVEHPSGLDFVLVKPKAESLALERQAFFTVGFDRYVGGGTVDELSPVESSPIGEQAFEWPIGVLALPSWAAPVQLRAVTPADFQLMAFGQRGQVVASVGITPLKSGGIEASFYFTRTLAAVSQGDGTENTFRPLEAYPGDLLWFSVGGDGTRVLVGRALNNMHTQELTSDVVVSTGANQPWARVTTRVNGATEGAFDRVDAVGGQTFFSETGGNTWRVLSSSDHLTTATERFSKPLNALHAPFVSKDALALALTLDGHHWVAPQVDGANPSATEVPWVIASGWSLKLYAVSNQFLLTDGIVGFVNSASGGAWELMMAQHVNGQGIADQWALAARRFTSAGTVAEQHLFPLDAATVPPAGAVRETAPDVGSAVEAPDGALLLQADALVWRFVPSTEQVSKVTKPFDSVVHHLPTLRTPTHVAIVSNHVDSVTNETSASINWSTDGTTWTSTGLPWHAGKGMRAIGAAVEGNDVIVLLTRDVCVACNVLPTFSSLRVTAPQ